MLKSTYYDTRMNTNSFREVTYRASGLKRRKDRNPFWGDKEIARPFIGFTLFWRIKTNTSEFIQKNIILIMKEKMGCFMKEIKPELVVCLSI